MVPFPGLRNIKVAGPLPRDTSPDCLLESIADALEQRNKLASQARYAEDVHSISILQLAESLSSASEASLARINALVETVSW
jgi:hypothetical protein